MDSEKNQQNTLELTNNASQFLSLEQLSPDLYQIQVSHAAPVGSYYLDIVVRDAENNNPSQKTRIRVEVLVRIVKF